VCLMCRALIWEACGPLLRTLMAPERVGAKRTRAPSPSKEDHPLEARLSKARKLM
jgi:hypothetical protein